MSHRNQIIKKINRDVGRARGNIAQQIVKDLVAAPFKDRLKIAWVIVKGRPLKTA
ncbi:MAG: hypothetical protein WC331_10765 [Candidatus Omnitrophota bacterium]|jgi:isocitrate dehydrogenase